MHSCIREYHSHLEKTVAYLQSLKSRKFRFDRWVCFGLTCLILNQIFIPNPSPFCQVFSGIGGCWAIELVPKIQVIVAIRLPYFILDSYGCSACSKLQIMDQVFKIWWNLLWASKRLDQWLRLGSCQWTRRICWLQIVLLMFVTFSVTHSCLERGTL